MSSKTKDQNSPGKGGDGDLSQELIDQMLNGGAPPDEIQADPWSDDALQAEIDAARVAAGVMTEAAGEPPAPILPFPSVSAGNVATKIATAPAAPTAVHPVQFMPLTPELPSTEQAHGIEMLMDVALEVSVELGRSHMSIGEILALRTGSVIELDKLAGEPVDVSVNGTLIARGEVVVVDEKFGVRITEVVSRARRLATVG
jgi:flagellar motor switch protein FliN/FliY